MKEKWELGLYPANCPKGLQYKSELEKLCFYYRIIALFGSLFLIFQNQTYVFFPTTTKIEDIRWHSHRFDQKKQDICCLWDIVFVQ